MPAQQSQSVAIPKRIPLVPQGDNRNTTVPPTKDARLLNCYAEYRPDAKTWEIFKRYGISSTALYSVSGSPAGRGMIYAFAPPGSSGDAGLYYIFGDTLYYNGTAQSGTLATSTGPVAMVQVTPTANWGTNGVVLCITDGQYGYYWAQSGLESGLVKLGSSQGFTSNQICPGFVYLDTYIYAMDVYGNIWGCENPGLPTNWPALDLVVVSNDSSAGVALARQLAYMIAFKANSIQVYYTAGGVATTAGSPLANIPEAQLPFGCLNGWTVASIDEVLLWVTSNGNSPQVMAMVNLAARVVSPPWVDRMLSKVQWESITYGGVYSWTVKHAGHRFYGLTLVSQNLTLVFDLDQKQWFYWTDQNGNYWPYAALSYVLPGVGSQGQHVIQHLTNGNIYYLDEAAVYPTDSGVLVPADIYTDNFDAGVDRIKQLQVMRFNADQQQGSAFQVRYSDDDYQTWSNFRSVDLGLERPYLKNLGSFYRRAFHFRHARPTPFRLKSVDLTMDIGTN